MEEHLSFMDSQDKEKKVFLRRIVNTIFIMLGHECNLNCKYCLQHPMVHNQISHKINPDIYDFIEQVVNENENKQLRLQFFGGEATLFWKNIQEIVAEVEKRALNISWAIMSNGKLINQEMVDFFNEHKFWVCVSYDGYNVETTRNYNPFGNEEHKKLLFQINELGLSAVLSAYNSPKQICAAFQELSDEYQKIHGYPLYMNIDDIFDTGGLSKDLLNIDYNTVSKEISEMTKEFLEDHTKAEVPHEHLARNVYINTIYSFLRGFYSSYWYKEKFILCNCQNGLSTLNLGIDGTLYPCHNTSESCGNIYMPYFQYLEKLMKFDDTRRHYEEECKDCIALAYCHCGCKMVKDKERKESYCKLKRAIFVPILSLVQNFKEENYKKDES